MHIPTISSEITVALPGERVRATVRRIINQRAILVELTNMPLTRNHSFRLGDIIGCVRKHNGLEEIWEAQDDRQFLAQYAKTKAVAKKGTKRVAAGK